MMHGYCVYTHLNIDCSVWRYSACCNLHACLIDVHHSNVCVMPYWLFAIILFVLLPYHCQDGNAHHEVGVQLVTKARVS
jgi:hypothetical protein